MLRAIDAVIDETVAEALAAQRAESAAAAARLEHSKNFWRSAAVSECLVITAGIGTGILMYRINQ